MPLCLLSGKRITLTGAKRLFERPLSVYEEICKENGFENLFVLHNNCHLYGDIALCGTRGWFFEEDRSGEHDEKVFKRELLRLEASLQSAGNLPKMVFLHYPPRYKGYECPEILELLEKYEVRNCFYGHLHGASHGLAMEGVWDSVAFKLLSADRLNFVPCRIMP